MASIKKLFLQKGAFGRIIVGLKIELLRWQKQLSGVCCKKGALKNFAKLLRKHLCWSFFWTNLQGWNACYRGSICCCRFCSCFKALTKSKFFLNKLVFHGLVKIFFMLVSSSRLTGVESGVKMLLVFDTPV